MLDKANIYEGAKSSMAYEGPRRRVLRDLVPASLAAGAAGLVVMFVVGGTTAGLSTGVAPSSPAASVVVASEPAAGLGPTGGVSVRVRPVRPSAATVADVISSGLAPSHGSSAAGTIGVPRIIARPLVPEAGFHRPLASPPAAPASSPDLASLPTPTPVASTAPTVAVPTAPARSEPTPLGAPTATKGKKVSPKVAPATTTAPTISAFTAELTNSVPQESAAAVTAPPDVTAGDGPENGRAGTERRAFGWAHRPNRQ